MVAHSLAFWYRIVVASETLLEAAATAAGGALRDYYLAHLEEERGHDALIRDDLRRLGVTDIPHSHSAAQLAGSQYYLLVHDDPALLLGYMRALESGALTPAQVDALEAQHGVTFTAWRHHAEHDPAHLADLERMILQLDAARQGRVAWNEACVRQALSTAGQY